MWPEVVPFSDDHVRRVEVLGVVGSDFTHGRHGTKPGGAIAGLSDWPLGCKRYAGGSFHTSSASPRYFHEGQCDPEVRAGRRG